MKIWLKIWSDLKCEVIMIYELKNILYYSISSIIRKDLHGAGLKIN